MSLRGFLRKKENRAKIKKAFRRAGATSVRFTKKGIEVSGKVRKGGRKGLEVTKKVVATPRLTREAIRREKKSFEKAIFGKKRKTAPRRPVRRAPPARRAPRRRRRRRINPLFDFGPDEL